MVGPTLILMYICTYNKDVGYEWDPVKATANFRKHGVLFSEAVSVLKMSWPPLFAILDSEGEVRWVTVGMDIVGRLLVVVYMWIGETIRFISARRATPRERQEYQAADPTRHPPGEGKI